MTSPTIKQISESFTKPKYESKEAKKPYNLAPMDLLMLSTHYIQKGLLFTKPSHFDNGQQFSIQKLLEILKDSLSLTLVHFYPLAGQLATQIHEPENKMSIYVDPNKGPGARFIHAKLDMTISDIISPKYVPVVVQSFFDHHKNVSYDGHFLSLLTIKITELIDGIFIGCSMNHTLGDGSSYWNFWKFWSETCRKNLGILEHISSPLPVHKRWFPDTLGCAGEDTRGVLPYTHPNEFISRYEAPLLKERIFHFSSKSMQILKTKVNEENNNKKIIISSFQALSALCWRAIVRANGFSKEKVTNCRLAANNRRRLNPPLPENYFGNCISAITTTTTVGELLERNLGWAASLINESVVNHNDKKLKEFVRDWMKSPYVYHTGRLFDPYSVMMGSSPRFDMYGNEFGFGKAIALRSGYANKFVGKVTSYQGYEGNGSVDVEICLPPHSMKALELDDEFMGAMLYN